MPSIAKDLSEAMASILVSQALHSASTTSLPGLGEITLRDALIVAGAGVGARRSQAWMLEREITPAGWTDAWVDFVVLRKSRRKVKWVAATELKWLRDDGASNASNYRKMVVQDFIRAADLSRSVEQAAYVAILSTNAAWERVTGTNGGDRGVMELIRRGGRQRWDLRQLTASPSIRDALTKLRGKCPIVSHLHTELTHHVKATGNGSSEVSARVWRVRKPQKSTILTAATIDALLPPSPAPQPAAGALPAAPLASVSTTSQSP